MYLLLPLVSRNDDMSMNKTELLYLVVVVTAPLSAACETGSITLVYHYSLRTSCSFLLPFYLFASSFIHKTLFILGKGPIQDLRFGFRVSLRPIADHVLSKHSLRLNYSLTGTFLMLFTLLSFLALMYFKFYVEISAF